MKTITRAILIWLSTTAFTLADSFSWLGLRINKSLYHDEVDAFAYSRQELQRYRAMLDSDELTTDQEHEFVLEMIGYLEHCLGYEPAPH
jgi:hypothetical protein